MFGGAFLAGLNVRDSAGTDGLFEVDVPLVKAEQQTEIASVGTYVGVLIDVFDDFGVGGCVADRGTGGGGDLEQLVG